MPSYHSSLTSDKLIANIAMLTFKTKFRGPITTLDQRHVGEEGDIIDETLAYFKANVFFKSYEIQSDADRLIIYLTLFISECLKKLARCANKNQAIQDINQLATSRFDIPGDPRFPLNSVYQKPKNSDEADLMRLYLTQLRQECGSRLVERVFLNSEDGKPSKWWTCFSKRKFMDLTLGSSGL